MGDKKGQLSLREIFGTGLQGAGMILLVGFLFYDSPWPLLGYPPLFFFLLKRERRRKKAREQQKLALQFVDAMRVVQTSLLAGMAIENCWKEAQKEVTILHGQQCVMALELQEMNRGIALNRPIEQLLKEFADRSGVEDIMRFSEVFSYAKRTGGDLTDIISTTTDHLREKMEVEAEIQVMVASKSLEQKIMDVIPMFILLFLRVSSDGYLDILYHNWLGVGIMSGCLGCYVAAIAVAEQIIAIQV